MDAVDYKTDVLLEGALAGDSCPAVSDDADGWVKPGFDDRRWRRQTTIGYGETPSGGAAVRRSKNKRAGVWLSPGG